LAGGRAGGRAELNGPARMDINIQTMMIIMTHGDGGTAAALARGRIGRRARCTVEGRGSIADRAVLSRWTADASMKLILAPFARWRFASASQFIVFAQNCQMRRVRGGAVGAADISSKNIHCFVLACQIRLESPMSYTDNMK